MNKSKFLKKSLAMVLAVLMIVAMIPLGASAAAPTLTKFYVDGTEAAISGTNITAEAKATSVNLTYVADAGIKVTVSDKNGDPIDAASGVVTVDLADKASVENGAYVLSVKTSTGPNDAEEATNYKLTINVKADPASRDATIKAVAKTVTNMTRYTIGASEITIYYAFGQTKTAPTAANFIPTNTALTSASINVSADTVTVTAADGVTTKTYKLTQKNEDGFTAFSIPDQTDDADIKADGATNTVGVSVPYEADFSKAVVPTFTVGETIKKVTLTATYSDPAVESGKTKVALTDDGNTAIATFYLWTDKSTETAVTLTLTKPGTNPEGVLKSIVVSGSNSTEVKEKTVAVELPNDASFAADETVTGVASANAAVSVPAQNGVTTTAGTDGKFTLTVNTTGKSFLIRVVSQDTKTTNEYTINLAKAASAEAKMTDFAIKGTLPDATEETTYTATWSGNTATVQLPYVLTNAANLSGFKAYATASVGADVKDGASDLTFPLTYGTDDAKLPRNGTAKSYTVVATDGTTRTYKVQLKFDAAKTGRTITAAAVVGAKNNADITSSNTYATSIGTALDADGKRYNTIRLNVPNSFAASTPVYFKTLTLSDGATAYVDTGDGKLTKIEALDPDKSGPQSVAAVTMTANSLEAVNSKGVITPAKAVTVYVLSEMNAVGVISGTTTVASVDDNKFTKYYVYGVKSAAETGKAITSMASTLDTNVTATLNSSAQKVIVKVPASYKDNDKAMFTLNFGLSRQAKAYTDTIDGHELKSDNGSADTSDATEFQVATDSGAVKLKSKTDSGTFFTKIAVKAENGEKTAYDVVVEVADPETGAVITSLKANKIPAVISGKDIKVTLPYGVNKYPVKLDITYSKLAVVEVAGDPYDADANYDLNSDITITVTSEDGKTKNVYTLKADSSEQFSDVKSGDWFYPYVMKAAAAGVVSGMGDGTFRPYNKITRQDFAVMVSRLMNADLSGYTEAPFKDVSNNYAMTAIAYCKDKGFISGYTDGTFKPTANITRQEAAVIIAKALNLTGTASENFKDNAKIASWAKASVSACKAAGIFNGDEKGNFNPTASITRAETATIMALAIE